MKELDHEKIDIPTDIQEFGERHGIPTFGSVTYRNGYVDGYRYAVGGIRLRASPHPANLAQVTDESEDLRQFKNFHRLLCERFGYTHDEKDWFRDQVSLIEHIAAIGTGGQAVGRPLSWIDVLREWFGGERYARDYEYLDANYKRPCKARCCLRRRPLRRPSYG